MSVSFAAIALLAQSSRIPYEEQMGPLYSISAVHFSQTSRANSIQDVDFRNMRVGGIRLKNGKYEHQARGGFESVALDTVYFPDGSSAIALYLKVTGGGSTNNTSMVQVFRLSNGRLDTIQRITWDVDATRSEKSPKLYYFDASMRTLVVRSSHYIPGDAHCCISAVDVVTFAWKNGRLEQISVDTDLSEYGKSQGKKLPE